MVTNQYCIIRQTNLNQDIKRIRGTRFLLGGKKMDLTDLYFVNEDGQIEINFDSLAAVTSELFVDLVKNVCSLDLIENISFDDNDIVFRLNIKEFAKIRTFVFFKDTKTFTSDSISVQVLESLGVEIK